MISSDTPYKLAEIIRDTWPKLYWAKTKDQNTSIESVINTSKEIVSIDDSSSS